MNACTSLPDVDRIYHNATFYLADSSFSKAEAMATRNGKIIATGAFEELVNEYNPKELIDLNGAYAYPGFIDPHSHFYWYAIGLKKIDLVGTSSFEEVLLKVKDFSKANPDLEWIEGRGWDHNDWEVKKFPTRKELDSIFPDKPVYLSRVDGHAALVNGKALELAGINEETKVDGGDILKDENGKPSGILVDNATDLVKSKIPAPAPELEKNALIKAQENCFAVGLTGVCDAGLSNKQLQLLRKAYEDEWLKIRIYAMMSPENENVDEYFPTGGYQDENITIKSLKLYADGALGSRGAALLEPYSDAPSESGFILQPLSYFKEWAKKAYDNNIQLNTHAIGDSANRFVLDFYAEFLEEENDRRWRIEHAQIVHPYDVSKFEKYSVIPSVQSTHATSDMYWADERLGNRVEYAYAFKGLLKTNGFIPNGSDFPVEDINPLYGFYAAVARKDHKGFPENGFQMENALSRKEALLAMTRWAAYSNFEERLKGSLEKDKLADFVVIEEDLMNAPENKLFALKVKATYLGDSLVFEKENE